MLMFMEEDELVPEAASVEVTSEPLYCICQMPWDKHNRKFMIECNYCKDWFHGSCVGLQEHESHDIEKYHCPKCATVAGPSQNKESGKPIQAGTSVFIKNLKEKTFPSSDEIILKMRGNTLTLPYLMKMGFHRPILVEDTDGLDLKVPRKDFSVRDVEKYVGSDRMLDVIDLQRQTDIKMSMKEFADYFSSPVRNKLYNLISLEFSNTQLSRLVEAPYIARKLDWVSTSWPKDLDEEISRPEVQKYCLISTKDSYTDFHIDFGGTSVWYHILWGEKIFYLIEPTPANLNLYSKWMASTDQYESFFAESVDHCYKCVLKKGQTLFIPTGWIHAVLTPMDSLVFGGNFLHSLNMDLQLQVYEIEKKLNVPAKYLFPGFEATHWFATKELVDHLQSLNKVGNVPQHLLTGAKALSNSLRLWSSEKLIAGINSIGKERREFIPQSINTSRLLKDLAREIRGAERRFALKPLTKDDKPMGIKTAGFVKSKQVSVVNEKSENDNAIHERSYNTNTTMKHSNVSTIPSTDSESRKIKHHHHRHHHRHHNKKPPSNNNSSDSKQQVTPLKLKIKTSASSSPQYMSSPHASTCVSPSYSGSSTNGTHYHQFPLNPKLISLNSGSSTSSPLQSPKHHHNGEEDGFKTDSSGTSKDQLPKLRLSLSSGEARVKIVETESGQDSDNLYIAEKKHLTTKEHSSDCFDSDQDNLRLKIDTDDEQQQPSLNNKSSHGRSKCKKHRKNKHKKNERNLAIDQVLAGTLDGINELFKSSNYNERINAYTKTAQSSAMVKDSLQDMLTMGEEFETDKRGRLKRKFNSSRSGKFDTFDSIEKVHQDDDFIYLPLTAGSDDEKSNSKKSKKSKDEDEQWSPNVKVGRLTPREQLRNPTRLNAKREHVEKGLEIAAAKLASLPHKSQKRKYKSHKKGNLASNPEKSSVPKLIIPAASRLNALEPLVSSSKNIPASGKLQASKPTTKASSYRFFDSTGKVKVLKSSRGIRDVIKRFTR